MPEERDGEVLREGIRVLSQALNVEHVDGHDRAGDSEGALDTVVAAFRTRALDRRRIAPSGRRFCGAS